MKWRRRVAVRPGFSREAAPSTDATTDGKRLYYIGRSSGMSVRS